MKPGPDQASRGPTPPPVNGHRLSRSQAQIAGLIAQGLTDKEVAARLGLAEGTVGSYLKTVFRRLRVKSRAALVSVILAAAPRRHSLRSRRIPTNVGIADAGPDA